MIENSVAPVRNDRVKFINIILFALLVALIVMS